MPAQAGIHKRHAQSKRPWIPAFAGMTHRAAGVFSVSCPLKRRFDLVADVAQARAAAHFMGHKLA